MLAQDESISKDSRYFIYSPSSHALEMFLFPLQCGRYTYLPGYRLERNAFDSFLLMYIQKGELTLKANDIQQKASTGDIVLLDCYAYHAYATDTGATCLWCHFDGATARLWYQDILARFGNVSSVTDAQPIASKLAAVYDTFFSGKRVQEPLLSKYLTDILTAIVLDMPAAARMNAQIDMAEKMTAYISEHFAEDLTVSHLASLAGLSTHHFIRTFKRQTGYTPHGYVLDTRIANARYLLRNSDLPVKEISYAAGFSCESVFCSTFKRIVGMTPAQYRRCR